MRDSAVRGGGAARRRGGSRVGTSVCGVPGAAGRRRAPGAVGTGDASVAHGDQMVTALSGCRVVGHHGECLAELVDQLTEQGEHLGAGLRVEGPGRFIGEDDVRAGEQGPGDGDTLALSPGQLMREVLQASDESETSGDFVVPGLVYAGMRQAQR